MDSRKVSKTATTKAAAKTVAKKTGRVSRRRQTNRRETNRRANSVAVPAIVNTVLPTPVQVEPMLIHAPARPARRQPHRWSLRHNFVVIAALTCIGTLAVAAVAIQADVTMRLIEAYGTQTTALIKSIPTTTRTFPTNAGMLTIRFPQRWTVTEAGEETIQWQLTVQPEHHVTFRVHQNDSDNVFTWLKNHQPEYHTAQVVNPTTAVQALRGIVVEGERDDGAMVRVVYFAHQKNLAEKYVIEVRMEAVANDTWTQRALMDFDVFIDNLRVES